MRRIAGRMALGIVVLLVVAVGASVRRDLPVEALRATYANADSRFATVEGVPAHFRDRGRGPAVLLLHGSNASLHTWEPWAAGLVADHRVVTVDLPGHGLTGPWPPDSARGYTTEDFVAFVDAFARARGLDRFTLAGNSMGGRIAWHYALAHPERVERLVLVDAASYPMPPHAALGFRLLHSPVGRALSRWVSPRSVFVSTLQASYADPTKVTPELVDRYWELNRRAGNRAATQARFALPPADDPELPRLQSLAVPTLVLWGREDHLIPVAHGERLHDEIAGSTLRIYDGVGHLPQEEAPERSLADLRAFLGGG